MHFSQDGALFWCVREISDLGKCSIQRIVKESLLHVRVRQRERLQQKVRAQHGR